MAREVQKITVTQPLTPTRYFLLKADGDPFKDDKKQPIVTLNTGRYTTKFTIQGIVRAGTSGPRVTLAMQLGPVDRNHHLNRDIQPTGLDLDGTALSFINTFDSFSFRSADGITENVHIYLTPATIGKILAAQKELAVKFRLESVPLGTSGECATTVSGSSKQRSCGNPYTGVVFSGKELAALKNFLKPYASPSPS